MVKITSSKWSILEISLFIMITILLIMILTKMFGHSATEIQIYLGFITGLFMIIGFIIKLYSNFSNLNREIREIKIGMKNSFEKVREDFGVVRSDISEVKEDMDLIKMKI